MAIIRIVLLHPFTVLLCCLDEALWMNPEFFTPSFFAFLYRVFFFSFCVGFPFLPWQNIFRVRHHSLSDYRTACHSGMAAKTVVETKKNVIPHIIWCSITQHLFNRRKNDEVHLYDRPHHNPPTIKINYGCRRFSSILAECVC